MAKIRTACWLLLSTGIVHAFLPNVPSSINIQQAKCSGISKRSCSCRKGALEALPNHRRFGGSSSKLLGGSFGRGGALHFSMKSEETTKSNRLRLESEKYMLQAEKLRLEAERDRLKLERVKVENKMSKVLEQDALITLLQKAYNDGGEEGLAVAVKGHKGDVNNVALFLRIADLTESAEKVEDREALLLLSEGIMRVIESEDKTQAQNLTKSIKEATNLARGQPATPPQQVKEQLSQRQMMDEWIQATMRQKNLTAPPAGLPFTLDTITNSSTTGFSLPLGGGGSMVLLPLWVPSSLLRLVGAGPVILDEDVEALQKQVFQSSSFYLTGTERSPLAVLFRGNIKKQDNTAAFEEIQGRLNAIEGLRDRVLLLLMADPTPLTLEQASGSAESLEQKPVFMAISSKAIPVQPSAVTYGLSFLTLAASAFTSFAYALGCYALNPAFYEAIANGDLETAALALPIMGGIVLLQLLHELGHAAVAAASKTKLLGPPIFVPSLQIGTFGAITPFRTYPKNRKQVFDISSAGPALSGLASIAVLVVGLMMTGGAATEALSSFPVVPASLFHSSALVGIATTVLLPSVMTTGLATPIPIHPLVVIGFAGVIMNALNLMPIGRLDGGRATSAIFGRRAGAIIGTITLLLQAISAIFNNYSLQLFWGLVVILFQRGQDIPALDEVSEIDDGRNILMLLMLAFSIFTLLPFPSF